MNPVSVLRGLAEDCASQGAGDISDAIHEILADLKKLYEAVKEERRAVDGDDSIEYFEARLRTTAVLVKFRAIEDYKNGMAAH